MQRKRFTILGYRRKNKQLELHQLNHIRGRDIGSVTAIPHVVTNKLYIGIVYVKVIEPTEVRIQ